METIYIIGCGAVGAPLAASLSAAGKSVVVVRASEPDHGPVRIPLRVQLAEKVLDVEIQSIGLSHLREANGPVVIATKAHCNERLAEAVATCSGDGPIVILQNGLGVERPFAGPHSRQIYRGVLYVTGEGSRESGFEFNSISPSALGIITGTPEGLSTCLATISTSDFPFRFESSIQVEVWKKVIVNCVFNSICPLLDTDNSVFARESSARSLARELIDEGVKLAAALDVPLTAVDLMEKVSLISSRSDKLISTLQDIRNGRETEMNFLNLEMARLALTVQPPIPIPKTEYLGNLVALKATLNCVSPTRC